MRLKTKKLIYEILRYFVNYDFIYITIMYIIFRGIVQGINTNTLIEKELHLILISIWAIVLIYFLKKWSVKSSILPEWKGVKK